MIGDARKITNLDWAVVELVCAAATASGHLSVGNYDSANRIAERINKAISSYIDALKAVDES